MRIERYGKTRFWAVYDGPTLVCVCVYKRGALNDKRFSGELPPYS